MTLMGSGFGDKRGKVQLGSEACKILSWGDTIVTCEVVAPQPAGDYTVTVKPHGSKEHSQPMTNSFTLMAPQITPGNPMQLVKPGEWVTIAGAFFGDKKGEVYLCDTPGDTVAAKVRDWSMDSISFEIPEGLTGYLALGVSNEVGSDIQRFWGTLTPLPPGATAQVDKGVTTHTRNNASGVYFNGQFWVFYLVKDDAVLHDHNAIHVECYSHTNNAFVSAPPCGGRTWAQVVPLVIDHELWAFCTSESGELCYKRFLTSSNKWENGEGSWNRIGTFTTDSHREIAPVYDPIKKLIMVYYWYTNTICEVGSFNRGTNWLGGGPLVGLTNRVLSAPGAVFYQQTATNGVTLLAVVINGVSDQYPSDRYLAVFWVKDGVVVKSDLRWSGVNGRPFLADLGEDYFELIWGSLQHQKLNKHTGAWLSDTYTYDFPDPDAYHPYYGDDFPPNLAVNYEQKTNNNSTKTNSLGKRWDAVLYLFWAKRIDTSTWTHYDNAVMSSVERAGFLAGNRRLPAGHQSGLRHDQLLPALERHRRRGRPAVRPKRTGHRRGRHLRRIWRSGGEHSQSGDEPQDGTLPRDRGKEPLDTRAKRMGQPNFGQQANDNLQLRRSA